MKRAQNRRIRPVAKRHQTCRILSRRNYRRNSVPQISVTPVRKTIPYTASAFRYRQRKRRYPKNRRTLTPSLRTRRRKLYLLTKSHQRISKANAFDQFESVLQEVSQSAESLSSSADKTDTILLTPVVSEPVRNIPVSSDQEEKKIRQKKHLIWILVVLLVLVSGGWILFHNRTDVTEAPATAVSRPSATSSQTPPVSSSTPAASPLTEKLEPQIEAALSPLQGEWSCYVKDLNTGETITYNSHKQHSASLIKLYTAGCFEQEVQDGTIQATDASLEDEAEMISCSDNDAWVRLETAIGQGSYRQGHVLVHQFARSHGFPDTGRLVDQNDNYNGDGGNNWTSVTDTGNCLDQIYHGTYVSKEASDRILDLMKKQIHVNKIPAGLPSGTVCANKTGELGLTQNDAAIVYGPKTNYILVVMSDGMNNGDEAIQHIIDLSSMIYHFMEEED